MAADLERLAYESALRALFFALLPKQTLVFSVRSDVFFENLFPFREDQGELYRRAADSLDRNWEANNVTIRQISRAFVLAATALAIEVIAMAALLTGTLI